MMSRLSRLELLLLVLFLSGCGILGPRPTATVTAVVTGNPTALLRGTATPIVTETPRVLRLWLPAQFDPDADGAPSRLLKARLESFASLHPDINLDVRIKQPAEPADMLEMLSLAGGAAPETLPDLVALPRADMEEAALKGIIHPIEGLTKSLDDSKWYAYARQLAHIQNSAYGLPFAGDALVLAYDPARYASPPESWEVLLRRPGALPLAGETPQFLFLISLYRSMNGGLTDAQNQPMLEEFALGPTLSVLERARINSTIMVESEETAWTAFLSGRAAWTVTHVTRALAEPSETFDLAPVPGLTGDPFTLATSWTWVLAGSNPENEPLAIELAEWLIEDEFLNPWVNEAGFLSTRSADVNQNFPALSRVAETAQPVPSNALLAAFTPILQDAVGRVLAGESAETVTREAVESFKE